MAKNPIVDKADQLAKRVSDISAKLEAKPDKPEEVAVLLSEVRKARSAAFGVLGYLDALDESLNK